MGSYPSDKVPQLTKYSFAIVNSAPSIDWGKHWIMIARLDEIYYFADSLGQKRTAYSFLTKNYRRMVPRKLQKTDNLCGFLQFIQHFFLLNSIRQTWIRFMICMCMFGILYVILCKSTTFVNQPLHTNTKEFLQKWLVFPTIYIHPFGPQWWKTQLCKRAWIIPYTFMDI